MGLSVFGYVVLTVAIGAPLSVIGAGIWAVRRRRLFVEDLGTVFLVPLAFSVVVALRRELHTGLAPVFWPTIAAVLCMYAFGIKVALVDRVTHNAHRNSQLLFLIGLVVAVAAALVVPPWYE